MVEGGNKNWKGTPVTRSLNRTTRLFYPVTFVPLLWDLLFHARCKSAKNIQALLDQGKSIQNGRHGKVIYVWYIYKCFALIKDNLNTVIWWKCRPLQMLLAVKWA